MLTHTGLTRSWHVGLAAHIHKGGRVQLHRERIKNRLSKKNKIAETAVIKYRGQTDKCTDWALVYS